jgi:hypothetical protein
MDKTTTKLDLATWLLNFADANEGYFSDEHCKMLNLASDMLHDLEIQAVDDYRTIQRLEAQYGVQVEENKRLMEWCEGVEADNDTLRGEIRRLKEDRDLLRRDYEEMQIAMSERGN